MATLCLDARDLVGESIVWSEEEQALYWVDIGGCRIHRFAPASGAHQICPTPGIVTSIGLRVGGGFIVALRRSVSLWKPGGSFDQIAIPEPDVPGQQAQ